MVSAADYAKNYGIKSGTELQPAEENNEVSNGWNWFWSF